MGSYIEDNLMANEQVIASTRVSNAMFVPPALITGMFAALAFYAGQFSPFFAQWLWLMTALLGLVSFGGTWLKQISTEIAVTNKRVILKTGFIKRVTMEQFLEKVDSISVDRSILDRVFNMGTIVVRGSGQSFAPMRGIDNPLEFRREVNQQVDLARAKNEK